MAGAAAVDRCGVTFRKIERDRSEREVEELNLRRIRHRLRKSLAQRGAIGTATMLLQKGLRPSARTCDPPKEYLAVHPFDQQFGVETSGLIFAEDLFSGKRRDLYNAGYFGVAPSAFRQILDRLQDQFQLEFEKYTFIDLGSGKGRALLIASEYPFRAVVGVELSSTLHAVAVANIAGYQGPAQQCRSVRSIEADATEFPFPPGPLVVYLWNPFEAPVFTCVLTNLEAALAREPREVYIVYIQPDLDPLLEASSSWRRLWHDEFQMSEEDYAAHAFPPRAEVCSAYCSVFPRRCVSERPKIKEDVKDADK
jgi:SAM-dependent methyltransferase